MKIISTLKKMVKQEIIKESDFYFSTTLFHDYNASIIFLATCIIYFVRNGHICLPIILIQHKKVFCTDNIKLINELWNRAKIQNKNWIQKLINNNNDVISNGSHNTPLILHNKNIYTYKLWITEKKILEFILKEQDFTRIDQKQIKKILTNSLSEITNNIQKISIILSIINRIVFIIGGPGTGKTTIVSKILFFLTKIFTKNLNIQLTALTGKAANHLTKSIKKNLEKLNLTKKFFFINQKAITIHSLLDLKPNQTFNYIECQKKLSDLDVLIVDEASMIDIGIMEKLVTSIQKSTKIIFLGDYNQLPSICGGHILKDICSYYREGFSVHTTNLLKKLSNNNITVKTIENYPFSNINDKIIMLKKNYRCTVNSEIYKIYNILVKNKTNDIQTLFNNIYYDIKFINLSNQKKYIEIISKITQSYKQYWLSLKKKYPFIKIMNIFNNQKLLCILKNGLFGVTGLNSAIENEMKKIGWIKNIIIVNNDAWYPGKPIMISKNNKKMNLVNGEFGITLLDKNNKLKVFFLSNEHQKKYYSIPINLIPEYKTNWAMTVHKSQGSEFFKVTLLLPKNNVSLLTKEIIYTAITRSKKKLTIYSEKNIFIEAIHKKIKRYSGIINPNRKKLI